MSWKGIWRNQHDSLVEVTDDADGRITGWYRTALEGTPFSGDNVPITGVYRGSAIAFTCGTRAERGEVVVSFAGTLRDDGVLDVLWHVAEGGPDGPDWRGLLTGHDAFTLIA